MIIKKFGGSSVKDAPMIKQVCDIVTHQQDSGRLVVLSAMKGITNLLVEAAHSAASGDDRYRTVYNEIISRHKDTLFALFGEKGSAIEALLQPLFEELSDILHGIQLVRECSLRSMDLVTSFGERLNCITVSEFLKFTGYNAAYFDARKLVRTDDKFGSANVEWETTLSQIQKALGNYSGFAIITGFIASSSEGITTTLGRNGSDYSAAIFGAALGVEAVEIWTDVDGVLSADPRYVANAFVVPEISYQEAMELSYFGAEVIHPYTLLPVVEKKIPIVIKNTHRPDSPGTRISSKISNTDREITGIASIENVSLINIEGGGMIGVPGMASQIFGALARAEVNVIMISQASSEHSICIVCRDLEANRAVEELKQELSAAIENRRIQDFELINNLEIIAVIGENMRGYPGRTGKLFSALGAEGINVLAIAQGSSERNISFVVESRERERTLNTVHNVFLGKGDS